MKRRTQTIAIPGIAVSMLVLMAIGAQIMDKASTSDMALLGIAICAVGLGLASLLAFLVERQ